MCAGEVHSLGFSEPAAGSDLASLRCRAKKVDGGWLVNGQKTWTSNAQFAAHIAADGAHRRAGLAPRRHHDARPCRWTRSGIEIRPIDTMGGREVNDVFLTDVFVPDDRLIGAEEKGWPQLMSGLNAERLLIGAMFLGQARRAFDDALEYVKEREQFGRADRLVPGDQAPDRRPRRPRSSAAASSSTTSPGAPRPSPTACSRARRRWSSSRSPRRPSASRSRACR